MNVYEIQMLNNIDEDKNALITIDDLDNQSERTLLYGYDCDRNTWHTYIQNGEIKTVIYGYDSEYKDFIENRLVISNEDYIPNKRLYPSACDYEFCKLLKIKGSYLPFTGWEEREQKQYYGKVV